MWDGEGPIRCAKGPRIRLAGIAARELDGSCSAGHPCPTADAMEAREALVELIGRPMVLGVTDTSWCQAQRCDVFRPGLQEESGQAHGAFHRDPATCPALWSAEVGLLESGESKTGGRKRMKRRPLRRHCARSD